MRARSRLAHRIKINRIKVELKVLAALVVLYFAQQIVANVYILHPVKALAQSDREVVIIEKPVEVIKEIEVDRTFKTQKQQVMAYLIERFGDSADDAITILNKCENSSFDPTLINKGNNNGTWDVGVMQINVDPNNTAEVERLKDYKYNIDRGYEKFKTGDGGKHKNSFYLWTCGYEVGHYTYLNRLRGE